MAAIVRATSSLPSLRFEPTSAANGAPPPENQNPPPLFSFSKPSWVVRTESNVRKASIRKADPPCVVCGGSGRVDCRYCDGRGRTNHIKSTMLPKGEWPKWCRSCGGSGLGYCHRCSGTGEYQRTMGFHLMHNDDTDQVQDKQRHRLLNRHGSKTFAELLLNYDDDDASNSGGKS